MAVEITEVRIKLMDEPGERLKAFCSVTFDDSFVVRDLKIIEGTSGPFVAMPSRKLTAHCPNCRTKNHLRATFCNQCGTRLSEPPMLKDDEGRSKLYADIAHPINSACREMIQDRVIRAFQEELERSKQPGYISNYDDFDAGETDEYMDARGERDTASGVEPKQVQQAEPPRGPHKAPARQPSTPHRPSNDEFGAGIFDD
jgi:stage V sporulation protein G